MKATRLSPLASLLRPWWLRGLCAPAIQIVLHFLLTPLAVAAEGEPPSRRDQVSKEAHGERTKPLWELGVAGGSRYGPDYPASDESHVRGLALPYFVYRGEIFRIGDGSVVRIIPVDSKWVELDVSVAAAFDARSGKNDAREGMPDLDYLLELGPQLTVHLARVDFASGARGKLNLNLPARAVFSTDISSVSHRGYVFDPEIVYRHDNLSGTSIDVRTAIGGSWATEELMDYFYEVPPRFARPDRPEYDASGGYLGANARLVVSWDLTESIRAHTGASFSYYGFARNEGSPLFTAETTVAVGAGLVWALWESERRVPSR